MTAQQKNRRIGYMKVMMVLFSTVVMFAYGSWKLIAEKMYYHITVEQYHQDNESITEAFKREAALRRHLEKNMGELRVRMEEKKERLELKGTELDLAKAEVEQEKMKYLLLESKYQKTKHEKDSLIAVIRTLRRAN